MSVEQFRPPSHRLKGLVPDHPLEEPAEDPSLSEEQKHAQRLQRELLGVYGNAGAAQQQAAAQTGELTPNQFLAGLEGRSVPQHSRIATRSEVAQALVPTNVIFVEPPKYPKGSPEAYFLEQEEKQKRRKRGA